MKKVFLIGFVMIVTAWNSAQSAEILAVVFGNVPQGTSVSRTFELDAGLFTLSADTPFDVVQSTTSPFKVSPLTGTLRRIKNTVFTVTVPSNTPPGVYSKQFKILVHRNSGDVSVSPLASATVLGFPFQITPPDALNLGTSATGSIQIKHIGGSPESYSIDSNQTFDARPLLSNINPGQTQTINITPGQGFPNSGTANDIIKITHDRTGEKRNIAVSTLVGGKPDLLSTLVAVKVFPRAPGENKTNIQVTYRLENIGFVETAACAGKITLDNDKVLDIAIPEMFVGQKIQDVTTTKLFQTNLTGNHKVKVVLDTDDKNNEGSENNNVAIKDIVIP